MLIQFLVVFGNVVGHGPHWLAEADRHAVNLYVALVGRSARGWKGISLGQVKTRFCLADSNWLASCVASGLSSGEGLVWRLRDGASNDKRLLVVESEFAAVLQVMQRQGNTLSPFVRNGWDSGNLGSLTKNAPIAATGAHVSIVAHITQEELRRLLNATEIANGFANRFLFVCAMRSQFLPDGGRLDPEAVAEIDERLKMAIAFASTVGEMRRDDAARALWHEVYAELGAEIPGLLGSVTSRAEAQVMRIACIYALLDQTAAVGREHLEAALEVWRYCFDSAAYLFGQDLGDPVADRILRAIAEKGEAGITRSDILDLFHRHRGKDSVDRALGTLAGHGLAYSKRIATGGRPAEWWYVGPGSEQKRGTRGKGEPGEPGSRGKRQKRGKYRLEGSAR